MVKGETLARLRAAVAGVAMELAQSAREKSESPHAAAPSFSTMSHGDWVKAVGLWLQHSAEIIDRAEARVCPACGEAEERALFTSYDGHAFSECAVCGCWYVPKQIDAALFDHFFERCPEARALAEKVTEERRNTKIRDADIARIGGYLDEIVPLVAQVESAPVSYLDAGCGVGNSLIAAKARGLSAHGIEADLPSVRLARSEGLDALHIGDTIPRESYAIVSFWETLEHICDPVTALQRCVGHLSENGIVAITIPNLNSLTARLLQKDCSFIFGGYNTPGHINLFTLDALSRLLDRVGLSVLDADSQYSSNPLELCAYLIGNSRGAHDMLASRSLPATLPATAETLINSVWPAVMLFERLGLAAPILKVIACRKGRESAFAGAIERHKEKRNQDITDEAKRLQEGETDYLALARHLQSEVSLRDEMLRSMEERNRILQERIDALTSRKRLF